MTNEIHTTRKSQVLPRNIIRAQNILKKSISIANRRWTSWRVWKDFFYISTGDETDIRPSSIARFSYAGAGTRPKMEN